MTRGSLSRAGHLADSRHPAAEGAPEHLGRVPRRLTATAGEKSTYLLSWEDKFARHSDWTDSNVFADVQADAALEPVLIPLPPAASSGLVGLGTLAGVGFFRRARRRLRGLR